MSDKRATYNVKVPMAGIIYPGIVKGSQFIHSIRSKSGVTVEQFRKHF